MHGAHELRIARTPAHALRNRQGVETLLNQCRHQSGRHGTALATLETEVLDPFRIAFAPQRIDAHAVALREAKGRTRRCTACVERCGYRRSATFDRLLGLLHW